MWFQWKNCLGKSVRDVPGPKCQLCTRLHRPRPPQIGKGAKGCDGNRRDGCSPMVGEGAGFRAARLSGLLQACCNTSLAVEALKKPAPRRLFLLRKAGAHSQKTPPCLSPLRGKSVPAQGLVGKRRRFLGERSFVPSPIRLLDCFCLWPIYAFRAGRFTALCPHTRRQIPTGRNP